MDFLKINKNNIYIFAIKIAESIFKGNNVGPHRDLKINYDWLSAINTKRFAGVN